MATKLGKPDKTFFLTVTGISLFGFIIFYSASLGLLSREGASFNVIALKQLIVLIIGFGFFLIVSKLNYRLWRDYSLALLIVGIVATLLVFVPKLGLESGGANRWIKLGTLTIQPSEILKLGYILYLAAWFSKIKDDIKNWKRGLLPFLIVSGIVGLVMISQPDVDTLMIMLSGGVAMFFAAGAKWKHLVIIALITLLSLVILAASKPYILSRVKTFFDNGRSPQGASYQIRQSLIAVGSGGISGRGFGQSIQKFSYLPEPIGDSIFSVASEEFGFVGSTVIIGAFVLFALAGLRIATRAPTQFGRLAALGIVIMIMTGIFINIASMLGLIPLTGTPLLFVSHGGSALLLTLIGSGIILNISRHQSRTQKSIK